MGNPTFSDDVPGCVPQQAMAELITSIDTRVCAPVRYLRSQYPILSRLPRSTSTLHQQPIILLLSVHSPRLAGESTYLPQTCRLRKTRSLSNAGRTCSGWRIYKTHTLEPSIELTPDCARSSYPQSCCRNIRTVSRGQTPFIDPPAFRHCHDDNYRASERRLDFLKNSMIPSSATDKEHFQQHSRAGR